MTPADIEALEGMLVSSGASDVDLAWAREQAGGLGLFVRSLVGLERAAAVEAFGKYLDDSSHTVDQVRFVEMIVDELSTNGFVDPRRLWEDPYTDTAPGPDHVFPGDQVGEIVTILKRIKGTAAPEADAS